MLTFRCSCRPLYTLVGSSVISSYFAYSVSEKIDKLCGKIDARNGEETDVIELKGKMIDILEADKIDRRRVQSTGREVDGFLAELRKKMGTRLVVTPEISTRDSGDSAYSKHSEPKLRCPVQCTEAESYVIEEVDGEWKVRWKMENIADLFSESRKLVSPYTLKGYKSPICRSDAHVDSVVVGSFKGVEVIIFHVAHFDVNSAHTCRKAVKEVQDFAQGWTEMAGMSREELVARKDETRLDDYDDLCVSEHKHRQIMLAFGGSEFPEAAVARFDKLEIKYPHFLLTTSPEMKAIGRYCISRGKPRLDMTHRQSHI